MTFPRLGGRPGYGASRGLGRLLESLGRGQVADRRMAFSAIVRSLDPAEDRWAGFGPGPELSLMNQLGFERSKEAFHGGVIVAIATAAHRLGDAVACQ